MRKLHDILDRLRVATLRRAAVEGLAYGVAASLAVSVVGGAWMGWGPATEPVRIALLVAISMALAIPVLARVTVISRRFADDASVAARMEACAPELRTDVRTALDFGARGETDDPLAAALRASLVSRLEDAADAMEPRVPEFVPRHDLDRVGWIAGALACISVVGALASPDGFGRGLHELVAGVPEVDAAGRATAEVPLVSTVDYEIVHPAYTRLPSRRVLGSTGDLRALVGSEVRFSARLLVPATDVVLRMEGDGDPLRTRVETLPGGRIAGTFPVTGNARWRLELTTPSGDVVVDPVIRTIRAVADAAPTVDLLEPGESLEVTPDQVVDLRYLARDDFGLSAVSVVWSFAGAPSDAQQVPVQGALGTGFFEEHVPFDLLPLGLQPRDEIVVFVEASDNDQVSGAKTGRSRAVSLRVASPDDRHDEVLAMKEQLFEEVLRQLAGVLRAGLNTHVAGEFPGTVELIPVSVSGADRSDIVKAEKTVHGRWTSTLELFETLLAAMDEDPLSVEAERAMLGGTYDRLYADVLDERHVLDRMTAELLAAPLSETRFAQAASGAATVLRTSERTVVILEDLVASHRADDVARAMEELGAARERLRDLLEQYRDTRDAEVRERIEAELRRLEQRMRELLQRLADQVEQLPLEHLNADAIERSEAAENISEMRSAMDMVREMLDQGDVDAALSYLDQLEAELEGLDQELSPLGDSEPQTLSEFDERMGDMMDELNNLEALETELEAETQDLLEEMTAERAQAIEEQTRETFDEVMRLVEDAERALDTEKQDRLGAASRQGIDAALEGLRTIERLLSDEDAAGAEAAATRLLSQLSDTQWDLRRDASMLARDPAGRAQADDALRGSAEAVENVGDARRLLSDLMQAARPTPNAEQRARMGDLGARQDDVRERLSEMRRQSDEMGERFPAVPQTLTPSLEQIGGQMEGASEALRGHRPRPALRGEQSALEQMRQMRDQMRQLTQRQRQREQRQANGRRPQDRVDVPEDGESARADFRHRVIESMRDESLETYEEEIRQYYERLLE